LLYSCGTLPDRKGPRTLHAVVYYSTNTQSPLDTFSRSFPVDREVTNLLQICCRLVVYVADLLATQWGSHQLATDLLQIWGAAGPP